MSRPLKTGLVVTKLEAAHGRNAVLHGVDLQVEQHCLAAVVGPSGCGKTTLLRAIAGFHQPTKGRIVLTGRLLDEAPRTHLPAQQRRVGYIPQEIALFPHLSVAANIGFGLARGLRAAKVEELLELISLTGYADRRPHQLSGGQQQRVALARALATEPDLLLLDEPFSALDAELRSRVRTDVADLLRRTHTTAVLVTHDAAEAMAFADVITIMNEGRIVQSGTPSHLYAAPANAAVARALGEVNLLPASTFGPAGAATALGVIATNPGSKARGGEGAGELIVLLRPRQLIAGSVASPGTTPARVLSAQFAGEDYRLEVAVAGHSTPLAVRSPQPHAIGALVHLQVLGSAHLLGPNA
jgi:iron(III) transport system ATP-binding protein